MWLVSDFKAALTCYFFSAVLLPHWLQFQITAQASTPIVTSQLNNSRQALEVTAPGTLLWKDPNLTGCFAGTGGSTTVTLSKWDYVPGSHGLKRVESDSQIFNLSCLEFLDMGKGIPFRIGSEFAKSPICQSYARLPGNDLDIPGLNNGDAHMAFQCCGGCELRAPEVQVYVWSAKPQENCSAPDATNTTTIRSPDILSHFPSPTPTRQVKRDAITAVVDGSVLTSPSYYLAIHGDVSVSDRCGWRGKTYHNPTVPVAPADLSTLSFSGGGIMYNGFEPYTGIYDPMGCRTYGLDNGSTHYYTSTDMSGSLHPTFRITYSMGPPYNPILQAPAALKNLDPAWGACTSWRTYGDDAYALFFGLYDPPRTLEPAGGMVDDQHMTLADPGPHPSLLPPSPKAMPSVVEPQITQDPKAPTKTDAASVQSQAKDSDSDDRLAEFIMQPFRQDSPKDVGEGNPSHQQGPQTNDPQAQDPKSGQIQPQDPQKDRSPENSPQSDDPPSNNPDADESHQDNPQHNHNNPAAAVEPGVILFASSTYNADDAGNYIIGGKTLSPGSEISIGGTPISLAPQGDVAVTGGVTQYVKGNPPMQPAAPPNTPLLTFDGSTLTADASSIFRIEGQSLSPGSQIEVHGTPISLAADGLSAVVGGSTQTLLPGPADPSAIPSTSPPSLTPAALLEFDGKTYTADSAGTFTIADQTLPPGGTLVLPSSTTLSISPDRKSAFAIAHGTTQVLPISLSQRFTSPNEVPETPSVTASKTFIVGGQTLTPGGVVTVSGKEVSWADVGKGNVTAGSGGSDGFETATNSGGPSAVVFEGGSRVISGIDAERVMLWTAFWAGGLMTFA